MRSTCSRYAALYGRADLAQVVRVGAQHREPPATPTRPQHQLVEPVDLRRPGPAATNAAVNAGPRLRAVRPGRRCARAGTQAEIVDPRGGPVGPAHLERPLVQHLQPEVLQHRQRAGQRRRPPVRYSLNRYSPASSTAAGAIVNARSSGPDNPANKRRSATASSTGSSLLVRLVGRPRTGTAPAVSSSSSPPTTAPPAGRSTCGSCRAGPSSRAASSGRGRSGRIGSVATVKCTRRQQRIAAPVRCTECRAAERVQQVRCIASRAAVVYRSRGKKTRHGDEPAERIRLKEDPHRRRPATASMHHGGARATAARCR